MRQTKIITNGNSSVVINKQGLCVWANLYVNTRNGYGDITGIRWEGKTIKGAERWAKKQLQL